MFRKIHLAVILTLILFTAVAADGRQRAADARESIDVVLVEVPVHVVDRAGNAVRGLTAENFEVFDEGKKRNITHFERIDLANLPSAPALAPMNPAVRRNFLLLFDLSYSSPGNLERSREAAREFIRRGLRERDVAAVGSYAVEQGFRFLTAFTGDEQMLLKAVDSLGHPQFVKAVDPLMLSIIFDTANPAAAPGKNADPVEEATDLTRGNQRANDDMQRARIRRQLQSFSGLARVLDRLRGQKQVLLLSEGFDAQLVHGREQTSSADSTADFGASVTGEVWKVDNDQRFGNTAAASVLEQMATIFKRSDVTLHSVDIKGLRSSVDAREGTKRNSNESLFLMADSTGGQLFKNSNDLGANLQNLLKQQDVIYILGFQGSVSKKGDSFHAVKVKLRNVPNARVHHRAGYYERTREDSAIERTLSLGEIMTADVPQDDVHLDALSTAFPSDIGHPHVPVILEIDGRSLKEKITGGRATVEIFVYAFDQQAVARDFIYQKVTLDLAKVGASLDKKGIKFYGALNIPPGDYVVKSLIRVGESGRMGFERVNVKVPDFASPFLLSPFVVEESREWVMVKAPPRRPADLDYPFTVAAESFVPASAVRMANGKPYEIALFGFNFSTEKFDLVVKLRNEAGETRDAKVVLVGHTPPANKHTTLLVSFTPAGLAAGRHTLEFQITPAGQQSSHRTSLPFVVQ